MPMPNRATPMGRPMASTEPKARIRITMAKARPITSLDGSSNSAKTQPPSSTSMPSISGTSAWMASRISAACGMSMSSGISTLAKAICPAWGPLAETCCTPSSEYGLTTRSTPGISATWTNSASICSATSGSSTPCSARKTIVPVAPAPWPPKLASRVSRPDFDSESGRLNWSR